MSNIMSNVCCKEFAGWVKSFTKIERVLTVVEAVLLVVFIVLLILLILHMLVCSKSDPVADDVQTSTVKIKSKSITTDEDREGTVHVSTPGPRHSPKSGKPGSVYNTSGSVDGSTPKPGPKCSWTPSAKTTAVKHYYEDGRTQGSISSEVETATHSPHSLNIKKNTEIESTEIEKEKTEVVPSSTPLDEIIDSVREDLSDGEEAEDEYARHVVALVKLKPPKDIIFGCILTIVSEHWVLTAASCIEAIEETDSLDSFVMMEHYGTEERGPLRAVDDVRIHPLYEGRNRSYDLAALRAAGSLTAGGARAPAPLASFLDYALLTLAQKFIILGYGAFRNIDGGPTGRRLRRAAVYKLPERQCAGAGGDGDGALRHLSGGRAVARGACGAGAGALCAGVLYSRGLPCNYCGGTPLLLARGGAPPALLALMAAADQCGVACEPARYVVLPHPDLADWIHTTLTSNAIQ